MCRVDWAEPADVYTMQERRARKSWHCCECRGLIAPGEQYEYVSMLFEGSWSTYRTCSWCEREARGWLIENCGGWVYEEMLEELEEHFNEGEFEDGTALDLGRLIIAMHRRRPRYISRHLGCTPLAPSPTPGERA